jgi:hypothetical protein
MGTLVIAAWFVIIGPLGALLQGGIAYSMFVNNLVTGVMCGFFVFLPLLLTLTWGANRWSELRGENRSQRSPFRLTTRPIESHSQPLGS